MGGCEMKQDARFIEESDAKVVGVCELGRHGSRSCCSCLQVARAFGLLAWDIRRKEGASDVKHIVRVIVVVLKTLH